MSTGEETKYMTVNIITDFASRNEMIEVCNRYCSNFNVCDKCVLCKICKRRKAKKFSDMSEESLRECYEKVKEIKRITKEMMDSDFESINYLSILNILDSCEYIEGKSKMYTKRIKALMKEYGYDKEDIDGITEDFLQGFKAARDIIRELIRKTYWIERLKENE